MLETRSILVQICLSNNKRSLVSAFVQRRASLSLALIVRLAYLKNVNNDHYAQVQGARMLM